MTSWFRHSTEILRPRRSLLALAILASTSWTPLTQAAEFPAVIPLSSLDGTTGFRLDGVKEADNAGWSVAGAGDVNGDGFADMIIGARFADPHGFDSGSSYVVFGKAVGIDPIVELSSLNGSNGFRLDGIGGFSGGTVATAGDVNGDGFADIVVGASYANVGYVVLGKKSAFPAAIDLSTLNGGNGFALHGVAGGDRAGWSIAGAGDVNGDGFDDVIIGAIGADPHGEGSGSTYVVFGKPSGFGAAINLSTLTGTNGFRLDGQSSGDQSGNTSASAGDINGDGFDDVIVGAVHATPNGFDSGASYVVFGKASGFPSQINLSSLNGINGFRLNGVAAGDQSAYSVASAGDVNGDGFDDVVVGAAAADPNGSGSGSSYVVFGKASGFAAVNSLSALNGSNGFRLDGMAAGDDVRRVASAGDINGDGFSDVIVGASFAGPNNSGASYVLFGKASGFAASINLSSLDGSNGFRLDGVKKYDEAGIWVDGAEDVNGDGFSDMIVGAFAADPQGDFSGSSYVVFGRAPDGPVTRVGSAADQYISGGPFDDTLRAEGGRNSLEGREGADRLFGGPEFDAASYRHALSGVTVNLANPAINTGDAAGDTYSSIRGLIGSRHADTLTGDGQINRIAGGLGPDVLTGGLGADRFIYNTVSESPPGPGRDLITDFNAGTASTNVDFIHLRAVDAQTGTANQHFTFVGTAPFTGTKGELRVRQAGTSALIMGDIDGDSAADFEIGLLNFPNLSTLTAADFRL